MTLKSSQTFQNWQYVQRFKGRPYLLGKHASTHYFVLEFVPRRTPVKLKYGRFYNFGENLAESSRLVELVAELARVTCWVLCRGDEKCHQKDTWGRYAGSETPLASWMSGWRDTTFHLMPDVHMRAEHILGRSGRTRLLDNNNIPVDSLS